MHNEFALVSEARAQASQRLHGAAKLPGWDCPWTVLRVSGNTGMGGCFAIYGVLPGGVLSKYSDALIHV